MEPSARLKSAVKKAQDAKAAATVRREQIETLRPKRTAIETEARDKYGVEAKALTEEAERRRTAWGEKVADYAARVEAQ